MLHKVSSEVWSTSSLAISARKAASTAHAPLTGPAAGGRNWVVVHALIRGHQLIMMAAAHLHMLAHKAALRGAFIIAAWVLVPFHHLLPILAPPETQQLLLKDLQYLHMLHEPMAKCHSHRGMQCTCIDHLSFTKKWELIALHQVDHQEKKESPHNPEELSNALIDVVQIAQLSEKNRYSCRVSKGGNSRASCSS